MLCCALGVTSEELEQLKYDIGHYQNILDFTPHVRFTDTTISRPAQFLSAFHDEMHVRDHVGGKPNEPLLLIKESLSDEQRVNLGNFFFTG